MLSLLPPLRVAVLSSHRAPGLEAVLADSLHGVAYTVVGVISSEDEFKDEALVRSRGVPCVHRNVRAFHRAIGARLSDPAARAECDAGLVEQLDAWAPDVVLCCSYLYLLTAPVLERWPGAVFSLHHSDMLDRDRTGAVQYPGLRAVRDAVFAGESETRSTVHLVTSALDAGPVVMRSWPFPIPPLVADARRWEATDVLKAYAYAHQEWMLRASWGPLMVRTLELASLDRGGLTGRRALLGAPLDLEPDGRLRPARTPAARGAASARRRPDPVEARRPDLELRP